MRIVATLAFLFFTFALQMPNVFGDITIAPSDLDQIFTQISHHLAGSNSTGSSNLVKDSTIRQNQSTLSFISTYGPGGKYKILTTFDFNSKSISKQINLNPDKDPLRSFTVTLQDQDKSFKHIITKTSQGTKALVYFRDDDVFIYTQTKNVDGSVELKEWIYARRPNNPHGSQYLWHFTPSSVFGWPIILEIKDHEVSVFRNMPIYGVPFYDYVQRQKVIETTKKAFKKTKIDFPYHERLATIPTVEFWTREGIQKTASIVVQDEPGVLETYKKSEHGVDWRYLSSHQQNMYNVDIEASPSDYPLLIDPSFEFRE